MLMTLAARVRGIKMPRPTMNVEWKYLNGSWYRNYPTFQTKNCEFAEKGTNNCLYVSDCKYKEAEFCRQKLGKGLEKEVRENHG